MWRTRSQQDLRPNLIDFQEHHPLESLWINTLTWEPLGWLCAPASQATQCSIEKHPGKESKNKPSGYHGKVPKQARKHFSANRTCISHFPAPSPKTRTCHGVLQVQRIRIQRLFSTLSSIHLLHPLWISFAHSCSMFQSCQTGLFVTLNEENINNCLILGLWTNLRAQACSRRPGQLTLIATLHLQTSSALVPNKHLGSSVKKTLLIIRARLAASEKFLRGDRRMRCGWSSSKRTPSFLFAVQLQAKQTVHTFDNIFCFSRGECCSFWRTHLSHDGELALLHLDQAFAVTKQEQQPNSRSHDPKAHVLVLDTPSSSTTEIKVTPGKHSFSFCRSWS